MASTPLTSTAEEKRAALRARLSSVAARDETAERYRRHANPYIARMLDGLGLDVHYVRGEGTRLYDPAGNEYLDFAGAYGALPFGHNPPEMWKAISAVQDSGEPSITLPSVLGASALLAERLATIAPGHLDQVWQCNSGAEAVEAALKLARAATGRRLVVSTRNSFHGKTLGALSATGRPRYQTPSALPRPASTTFPSGTRKPSSSSSTNTPRTSPRSSSSPSRAKAASFRLRGATSPPRVSCAPVTEPS